MFSCQSDEKVQQDFTINVHLKSDPARINPMVGNPTTESTEINTLLFQTLAHYDPISYDLSPVLIKEIVPGREITEGDQIGGIIYDYEILEEAVWDDGTPITGEDYLFTLKVAKNPSIDAASWRGLLKDITAVEVDSENPKKFSVTVGRYYHLARESTCTFEIFPKHIYDPEGVMDTYSISQLNNTEALGKEMESDSTLASFAKIFNGPKFTQETVSGSGPYKLKAWEVDQYIVLEKKENYWGSALNRTQLKNNPKEITFRIIADENAAITLLKDGSIDLMNVRNATAFDNLKESEVFEEQFTLHTPPLSRFYYIGLNNRKPELADPEIRRALAHLVDVDNIIETLENGYAKRQVGTIMPSTPFYDSSLKPIEYDPQKAIEILDRKGWKDTNGNGSRDKIVNGELVEMEVDFLASTRPLGQKVGLLLQDNAKQAGINVNLVIKEGRKMSEALYGHDFEASASATGLSLAPYDPYQRWHSDNDIRGKGNIFGYVNEKNDATIEQIRNAQDPERRMQAYRDFQTTMYEEQPVIFLYSPVQKFVLSKKFKGLFSNKRPGYFLGAFEEAI